MRSITLWKYNKRTGYWEHQRECELETAQRWLEVFQKDEPEELFKLSKNKPKLPPSRI
jgi:hypothetical protein